MRVAGWGCIIALLVGACSSPGDPDPKGSLLTVENRTIFSLVAFPYMNGDLVDPIPVLGPGSYDDNVVRPGKRLEIDRIGAYSPGTDVGIFIYVVQPNRTAVINRTQTVPVAELMHNNGLVRIDSLAPLSEGP